MQRHEHGRRGRDLRPLLSTGRHGRKRPASSRGLATGVELRQVLRRLRPLNADFCVREALGECLEKEFGLGPPLVRQHIRLLSLDERSLKEVPVRIYPWERRGQSVTSWLAG